MFIYLVGINFKLKRNLPIRRFQYLERVARIELANSLWQSGRLPLHHTRIKNIYNSILEWVTRFELA